MDSKTNRRNNLRKLVEEFGTQAKLGRELEMDPAYLSQVLNEHNGRGLGDKAARKVEAKLNLARGWMDSDHEKDGTPATKRSIHGHLVSPDTAEIAAELEKLAPHEREAIGKVIYLMVGKKKRGALSAKQKPAESTAAIARA